jgi:hypothetical protein
VVNGQLNMLAIMNTQQGSYHGVFEAITGIAHPSPHCFVTELCAVRKQDFMLLKQHLKSRWPNKPWLDAVIDAVPGMPTVPPWGTGNIIKWFSEYESIQKINSINFNLQDMNSPKDFWRQINLMAVNLIGQENIMQEIENLRALKAFDKPEYYSRLKKEIRELCNDEDHTKQSDLISELDRKIKATKKYYR